MSDLVEELRGYPATNRYSSVMWEAANEIERLRNENKRKDAQIVEAISILDHGTDYEMVHVCAILSNALENK